MRTLSYSCSVKAINVNVYTVLIIDDHKTELMTPRVI